MVLGGSSASRRSSTSSRHGRRKSSLILTAFMEEDEEDEEERDEVQRATEAAAAVVGGVVGQELISSLGVEEDEEEDQYCLRALRLAIAFAKRYMVSIDYETSEQLLLLLHSSSVLLDLRSALSEQHARQAVENAALQARQLSAEGAPGRGLRQLRDRGLPCRH